MVYGDTNDNELDITNVLPKKVLRFYGIELLALCPLSFEFRVVIVQEPLPTIAKDPSSTYFVTHSWNQKKWILTFANDICTYANAANTTGMRTLHSDLNSEPLFFISTVSSFIEKKKKQTNKQNNYNKLINQLMTQIDIQQIKNKIK